MSFDADVLACAAIVEKGDPDRFAAAMAGPVPARRILFPLYAFNVEASRAPWVTQESMIAEMRLQWWRDALEEIGQGGQVRRHEVVTPLGTVIGARSAEDLDRLVAARRWDIYKDPFENAAHFENYLTETAGALMTAAARALEPELPEQAGRMIRDLGYCTGLARFLQAVPAFEAQNRIPLLDGRREAVAALGAEGVSRCPDLKEVRRAVPATAWPAVTEAFMTRALLAQAASEPERVAGGRLELAPLKRSFLLWRWS